jgi:hypothetical protein
MPREKVARILDRKPALRARIEASRSECDGQTTFEPERNRVSAVVTKLAQGHALYELHESCTRKPDQVSFFPLLLLSDAEREDFETPPTAEVWPEVGSRAMQRLLTGMDVDATGWLVVQPERYRFVVSSGGNIDVRIVIYEYLGCYVQWVY